MKLIKKKQTYTIKTGIELTVEELVDHTLSSSLELDINGDSIQIDKDDPFKVVIAGKTVDASKVKLIFNITDPEYLKDLNESAARDSLDAYANEN